MAKLPATAVTTKMAHASRPTSTILPTGVSGFVILDETVSNCTGESKEKAARIANATAASSPSKVGRKGGKSGSYDDWSKQDLMQRAKEIGIKGRSTMSKQQLIKALRDH